MTAKLHGRKFLGWLGLGELATPLEQPLGRAMNLIVSIPEDWHLMAQVFIGRVREDAIIHLPPDTRYEIRCAGPFEHEEGQRWELGWFHRPYWQTLAEWEQFYEREGRDGADEKFGKPYRLLGREVT